MPSSSRGPASSRRRRSRPLSTSRLSSSTPASPALQAVAELRALLAANGTLDPSVLPEPREPADAGLRALAADPGDLSGLRPWLESFQQQLGPPTGELPEARDRS